MKEKDVRFFVSSCGNIVISCVLVEKSTAMLMSTFIRDERTHSLRVNCFQTFFLPSRLAFSRRALCNHMRLLSVRIFFSF